MLISAGAATWNVEIASCHAAKGAVIHAPSGRKLTYGGLVDQAAKLPVPNDVVLKDRKDFTLIGTSAKRTDATGKVNGTAEFGIDTKIPGMKIATGSACPVIGGKLGSVDESKARNVKGVIKIVRLDDAVAVIADHMGAAKKGLEALVITWDQGASATFSTADMVQQLKDASSRPAVVAVERGDAVKAMSASPTKIDAVYQMPLLAHAAMEPMNYASNRGPHSQAITERPRGTGFTSPISLATPCGITSRRLSSSPGLVSPCANSNRMSNRQTWRVLEV